MKLKKFLAAATAVCLTVALTACGAGKDDKTIVVGASPSPHAEILEQIKPALEKEGYTLEVKEFTDFVMPNTALNDGDLDANFFQHEPYLVDFNAQNGTDLSVACDVHFEPLGIYPGKSSDIKNIPNGAQIAVPNDTTNEARALNLLQDLGVITLKEGVGLAATPKDIVSNPKNVKIVELEAAQVALSIKDVDFGIVNGNYALSAGIEKTVITTEDAKSAAAVEFANIIAVRTSDLNSEKTQALVKAITTEDVKTFIQNKYGVVVIPVF